MKTITFKIPGKPVGKGRPKFSMINGHPTAYTPAETRDYESKVKMCFLNYCYERKEEFKFEGNIGASITAYCPIPSSLSKKKQAAMDMTPCPKKPDADNIAKAILDALSGVLFDDDNQVVELNVEKCYSKDPCAIVTIWEKEETVANKSDMTAGEAMDLLQDFLDSDDQEAFVYHEHKFDEAIEFAIKAIKGEV